MPNSIRSFIALFKRDLHVFFRNFRSNMLRVVLQPLFFIVVFGIILAKAGIVPENFSAIMAPGIITIGLMFSAGFGVVALVGLSFFRDKEIRSQIQVPISIEMLGLEKILFGVFQGVFSGIIILLLELLLLKNVFSIHPLNIVPLILIMILTSAIFASLGLIVSSMFKIPALMFESLNLVVTTFMFFGGTFFSLAIISSVNKYASYILYTIPNIYTNEALRGLLTNHPESLSLGYCLLGLFFFAALFILLGLRAFRKRAIN